MRLVKEISENIDKWVACGWASERDLDILLLLHSQSVVYNEKTKERGGVASFGQDHTQLTIVQLLDSDNICSSPDVRFPAVAAMDTTGTTREILSRSVGGPRRTHVPTPNVVVLRQPMSQV